MTLEPEKPIALTIAGSDPSAGAGIQADLKTFSALGVYGATVITALTAQNTKGVSAIHVPPADFFKEQLRSVLTDLNIKAIKIGMLANIDVIHAVTEILEQYYKGPIVLDPVMVATSGDRLLQPEAEKALKDLLLPKSSLLTPNLAEAACLLDQKQAESELEAHAQLDKLLQIGPAAVLLKGGHGKGKTAVDYLKQKEQQILELSAKRIDTKNTHGTGCTLSAAICAYLAKGDSLENAVKSAKSYLTKALKEADTLSVGKGHGPVDHFHNIREID